MSLEQFLLSSHSPEAKRVSAAMGSVAKLFEICSKPAMELMDIHRAREMLETIPPEALDALLEFDWDQINDRSNVVQVFNVMKGSPFEKKLRSVFSTVRNPKE